jgi:hypothetical protein
MASTYSDLKIQLMTTGENDTTWGTVTNTNLGTAIEEAISGTADVTFASANVTLTLVNSNATQTARNMRLNLIGTTGGSPRDLIVPAIEKMYVVNNGCGNPITVKVSGQTGVSVPPGASMLLFNDGTDVRNGIANLPISAGGIGTNTITANAVVLGNGSSALQTVSPGTSGNVLTSNGSTWISSTAFVSGMIMMWSGSIVSIPSGWALCNGSNGTPDLRDRFVVGAGSTYNPGATGGSADAVVVSHTHSVSGTAATKSITGTITVGGDNQSPSGIVSLEASTGARPGLDNASGQQQRYAINATHDHTISGTAASTGSSGTNANLPPYYALAFIMKL